MERLIRNFRLLHGVGDLILCTLLYAAYMLIVDDPDLLLGGKPWAALAAYLAFGVCFLITGLRIRKQLYNFNAFDNLLLIAQILISILLAVLFKHPLVFLLGMLYCAVLVQWQHKVAILTILGGGAATAAIAFFYWPISWHSVFGLAVIPAEIIFLQFIRTLMHEAHIEEELMQKNRELQTTRALLSQIAAQDERIRIARDMHDVLGHGLTGLSIHSEILLHQSTGENREKARALHTQAQKLLIEVRNALSTIRAPKEFDLSTVLQNLVDDIPTPPTRLVISNVHIYQPQLGEVILRCVQEGTTNAIRHARASSILVTLSGDDQAIRLTIADDGRGFDPDIPTLGSGLTGIRERVATIGGTVSVKSSQEKGTTLSITLPTQDTK